MSTNIAVGGFQHETNTFSPYYATFDSFIEPDGWPGMTQGDVLLAVLYDPEVANHAHEAGTGVQIEVDLGAHPCQLADLPYRNLRQGIRLGSMGPRHPGFSHGR